MALSLFGATAALVQSRFFPQHTIGASSKPTDTAVGYLLNDAAAQVNGALLAVGIAPSSLTDVATPVAYQFCQRAVLLGAAADLYPAIAPKDKAGPSRWAEEFTRAIREIRENAKAVLADAWSASGSVGSPRAFCSPDAVATDVSDEDVELSDPAWTWDKSL